MVSIEKIVGIAIDYLINLRYISNKPKLWEYRQHTNVNIHKIYQRICQNDIIKEKASIGEIEQILDLTLAMLDADYISNESDCDWSVWKNDTTGEIISSYNKRDGWTCIITFICEPGGIRKRNELFSKIPDVEFYKIWDMYIDYYRDEVVKRYSKIITKYLGLPTEAE